MVICDIFVPKENRLLQMNELVDLSFVLIEWKHKYCLDTGRNTLPPTR